jgi:single-stranded-DNA-specific exonuclease
MPMTDMIRQLLKNRAIPEDSWEAFLSPNYVAGTHDPFLMKDMDKAVERILKAIENKENIVVYSDYDCDGIPGAVILHDFFKVINYDNFTVYIPDRHDEGYGLHRDAVESFIAQGTNLIITIDLGITAIPEIAYAQESGVDVIVTDHHIPHGTLPPAFAILNPKQPGCDYPFKELCGSGVMFKLIQALITKISVPIGFDKWLLDMVGLATLSDMVPLVGENRLFAYYGLMVLRKSPRKGLIELLKKLKINQKYLNEDDIGYMITPRINAASRMGLPMDAFHLLTAENEIEAQKFTDHLDKINNERKGVVASLVKEAKKHLHERYGDNIPNVIVLGNPDWRPSLLGLVANTCAEEFGRPAFFWGRDGGNIIKGSCRSEGKTNVVELMQASLPNTFIQFGGHKYSGGFAVANDEIHFLEKRLNEAFGLVTKSEAKTNDELIDLEMEIDDVGDKLFDTVNKLAPFGIGNPKPIFLFRKLIPISIKKFGKTGDHLELIFKKSNGQKVCAISFFGAKEKWVGELGEGKVIDLIASIEKSMFRGRAEIRLRVEEIHIV